MTLTSSRVSPFLALAGGAAILASIVTFASGNERLARRGVASVPQAAEATRIEVDNVTHTIRFYVDGRQAAAIDARGLAD